ncbi:hypothetical protein FV242_16715 [Methylobacterium sp. WL64]|uniref:hypothetical protein n=1 Tax=Methylobacterium sp. WL64 TaxID=2603894 RepID=UPI0011CA5559|nr:hypothetical protein [Methylobacterium sp. WL64]TXN02010.1 hypothetical protein FV242_16715 [Methylobacterium sp. WL64]
MPEAILLDNDVVLKVCVYRCHEQLMATLTAEGQPPAMLRLGRYALRSRLSKPGRVADREGAASIFEGLLERFMQIDRAHPAKAALFGGLSASSFSVI